MERKTYAKYLFGFVIVLMSVITGCGKKWGAARKYGRKRNRKQKARYH